MSTFDKQKFGRRLKKMRIKAGYERQIDLAHKLGTVVQTISNYENGIRLPDAEMLSRIVEVLPCNADYLLGYEDKPTYEDTFIADEFMLSQTAIDALRGCVNAAKEVNLNRCIQSILLSYFITSEQFIHLSLLHEDCANYVLTNALLKHDEKNDYLDSTDRAMLRLFGEKISGINGIDKSNLYMCAAKQKAMGLYGEFFDVAIKRATDLITSNEGIAVAKIKKNRNSPSKN